MFFGWLGAFIGQWFYLVVVFPIGIGFGVFGAGYAGVRVGKVRSPVFAALAGLFGGFVATLTFHYCIYVRALNAVPEIPPQERSRLYFSPEGFRRFIDARATDGVRISSTRNVGGKDQGMNLGYVGSYIYWFVEFLLVAGIGFGGMLLAAAQPFCARCKSWKENRQLGTLAAPPEEIIEALKEGDVERLADLNPSPHDGQFVLSAAVCANCRKRSDVDIKLEHAFVNKKGEQQRKKLMHLTYPRSALAAFEEVFRRAVPKRQAAHDEEDEAHEDED